MSSLIWGILNFSTEKMCQFTSGCTRNTVSALIIIISMTVMCPALLEQTAKCHVSPACAKIFQSIKTHKHVLMLKVMYKVLFYVQHIGFYLKMFSPYEM